MAAMATPAIDAAEDMLIDFDRIDRRNKGRLTPGKVDSILRMHRMDLPWDWIAKQLQVDEADVEKTLSNEGYRPK